MSTHPAGVTIGMIRPPPPRAGPCREGYPERRLARGTPAARTAR